MTIPLIVLAILSAIGGFMGVPEALHGSHQLAQFMDPLFQGSKIVNPNAFGHLSLSHSTEYMLMGISVGAALIAAFAAWTMYAKNSNVPEPESVKRTGFAGLVYNKFYVDELYDTVIVRPLHTLSDLLTTFGEFFIDLIVEGAGYLTTGLSAQLKRLQTGATGFYVFAMVLGIVVILFWNLLIR
jgi:NADH-quinone oxidoreductase subunit L